MGQNALGALTLHKWNLFTRGNGGEREKELSSETQSLITGPEGGF